MSEKKQIVLGVTASIALYKACDLVRRLKDAQYAITVVMTEEACGLINPIVFQSLSQNKVYADMFEPVGAWENGHISLAERADLIVVAPATANSIGKFASGICDDLLTCVVCATRAPVLIAPAMNTGMFQNKITQDNIKKLKTCGYRFIEPIEGMLACGKKGIGCLAEVEAIVKEVKKIL